MPEMYDIYATHSANYDELVNCEDADGNFARELLSLCDWKDKTVFEAGAGTGRVTSIYAKLAKRIIVADRASHMIDRAKLNLADYSDKIIFEIKDNLHLSELTLKADIFVEGWSFGHSVCDVPYEEVDDITDKLINQTLSLTKPGGRIVLVETLGTGNENPKVPADNLRKFYDLLENKYSFKCTAVRTDYLFDSVESAARICGFFFGDEMRKKIIAGNSRRVLECTGIWVK